MNDWDDGSERPDEDEGFSESQAEVAGSNATSAPVTPSREKRLRALLPLATDGNDTTAQKEVIATLRPAARAGATRSLGCGGDQTEIEDVIQATIIAYFRQWREVRSNHLGFVYTIARNKGRRKLKRRQRDRQYLAHPNAVSSIDQELADNHTLVDDQLSARQKLAFIHASFPEVLTPQEAAVFKLMHVEQLDAREVCERLAISQAHLRVVRHNIRKKLKKLCRVAGGRE